VMFRSSNNSSQSSAAQRQGFRRGLRSFRSDR
jgi:hypothetical protein